jgi:hypothetical protein
VNLKTHFTSSTRHHTTLFAMSDSTDQPKKERFAPKEPVTLQPPKDDIMDRDYLAKCNGMAQVMPRGCSSFTDMLSGTNEGYPTLVAIKVSP